MPFPIYQYLRKCLKGLSTSRSYGSVILIEVSFSLKTLCQVDTKLFSTSCYSVLIHHLFFPFFYLLLHRIVAPLSPLQMYVWLKHNYVISPIPFFPPAASSYPSSYPWCPHSKTIVIHKYVYANMCLLLMPGFIILSNLSTNVFWTQTKTSTSIDTLRGILLL